MKKILVAFALLISVVVTAQNCPSLLSPASGATNVAVDTSIEWEAVEGVPSYMILLGTTVGGNDLGQAAVGGTTNYTPPLGLPENTQVFVTIILEFIFGDAENVTCNGDSYSFTTRDVTTAPNCSFLELPINNAENVATNTLFTWPYSSTATGYLFSLGTASGDYNIINKLDVGNTLNFNPPQDLEPETRYYAQIVAYNENGEAAECLEITFLTRDRIQLPGCTALTSPENGETNVGLDTQLVWEEVPGATGYLISIGTTPGGTDIADQIPINGLSTNFIELSGNTVYFVRIVPFNEAGQAISCQEQRFSTAVGCGPFIDPRTGESIDFAPNITLSNLPFICSGSGSVEVTAPRGADGYEWYQIRENGSSRRISEERTATFTEAGNYVLETYNFVETENGVLTCPSSFPFEIEESGGANILDITVQESFNSFSINVLASGIGDYEFALDNIGGPFQDSNRFTNITSGDHTIYVRDKKGCGIRREMITLGKPEEGFPAFFTPNADNSNNFWRFVQPIDSDPVQFRNIWVFDRYGTLLFQTDNNLPGWDGNVDGRPVPEGGYWFRAIDMNGEQTSGFFTLKR